MKKQYNFQKKAEESKTAKAFHSNVHISTKYSTEMARELLGKKVKWAKSFLQDIIEKKRYLPLRRYRIEMGHRKEQHKVTQSLEDFQKYCARNGLSFWNRQRQTQTTRDWTLQIW